MAAKWIGNVGISEEEEYALAGSTDDENDRDRASKE